MHYLLGIIEINHTHTVRPRTSDYDGRVDRIEFHTGGIAQNRLPVRIGARKGTVGPFAVFESRN